VRERRNQTLACSLVINNHVNPGKVVLVLMMMISMVEMVLIKW